MEWRIQATHRQIANLDDDPQDIPLYGEDPEGQAPLVESDLNVEVSPTQLPNVSNDERTAYLCNTTDLLQESSSLRIDSQNYSVVQNWDHINLC